MKEKGKKQIKSNQATRTRNTSVTEGPRSNSKHHPNSTGDGGSDYTPSQSLHGNSSRSRLRSGCAACARRAGRVGRGVGGGRGLRGVERTEGLDLEWLGSGVDVRLVKWVGEENGPSCTGRLVGFVLRDDDGAVKVVLDGDDGEGCDGNRRASIAD